MGFQAPAEIQVPAPTSASRSTTDPGPRKQWLPIAASGCTVAPAATTQPPPITATPDTYAEGWITVRNWPPSVLKVLATRSRAWLSVIATTTCTGSTESKLLSIPTSPSMGTPLTLPESTAWASS